MKQRAFNATQIESHGQRGSDHAPPLTEKDFSRLASFIYDHCGIKITDSKKLMLEARLQKRLRLYSFFSFADYCDYLFSPEGLRDELVHMIDVVTTNKTDFFRESAHFDYLSGKAIPDLVLKGNKRNITVWSAGCSSGEEPYTLAMVLSECGTDLPDFSFLILAATDISTRVLDKAKLAAYDDERIEPIPGPLKSRYLLRSRNPQNRVYRIVPELRRHVQFRRLNFMDGDFGFRETMDVIFCRNVIIYFDKATQEKLLSRFCQHLSPQGYLFQGHSETLLGMDVPLTQVAPTVYRKSG